MRSNITLIEKDHILAIKINNATILGTEGNNLPEVDFAQ